MNPTHAELVTVGREWLRTKQKCSVVVSEIKSYSLEEPDVLGWYGLRTHLIECKTSRADFQRDAKKLFRQVPERGLGTYRWYLTLPNVIKDVNELPKNFGHLIYVDNKIKIVTKALPFTEKSFQSEAAVLLSVIKRLGQQEPEGCSIRCYTYQTKNTSAVDISY